MKDATNDETPNNPATRDQAAYAQTPVNNVPGNPAARQDTVGGHPANPVSAQRMESTPLAGPGQSTAESLSTEGTSTEGPYTSRPLVDRVRESLKKLKAGQKLRMTHLVRVGSRSWPATVTGTFRHVDSLATGIATDRDPRDDIIVALVHFTKENGELSSLALDEHTRIEILEG